MSFLKEQSNSCAKHAGALHLCSLVKSEDVLNRLSRAKDTGLNPQMILLDVREERMFQDGHILTAYPMNCYTKTMAKRSIVSWDLQYADVHTCPAPIRSDEPYFCTKISEVLGPCVVLYDQRGNCPGCAPSSAVELLISALITRGNNVYFMIGGFEAFRQLRSSDFIDRGPPGDFVDSHSQKQPNKAAGHILYFQGTLPANRLMTPNNPRLLRPVQPERFAIRMLGTASQHFHPPTVSRPDHSLHRRDGGMYAPPEAPITSTWVPSSGTEMARRPQLVMLSDPCDPDNVLEATVSEILPDLFIGNARDAQDEKLLRRLHVTHIINVTDNVPMPFKKGKQYQYLHLPASDTDRQDLRPSFDRAVQFIEKAHHSYGVVLVHCQAGVSRSVALVIAFLLKLKPHFNVMDALEFVQSRRPVAGPSLHFMGQLQRYHDEMHTHLSSFVSDSDSSDEDEEEEDSPVGSLT